MPPYDQINSNAASKNDLKVLNIESIVRRNILPDPKFRLESHDLGKLVPPYLPRFPPNLSFI